MEDKNKIEIFRPFGPLVAKTKIPEEIVNKLNDYVDQIIKDEKKSKDRDYGAHLAGNVTQEFTVDFEFAKEIGWLKFLADSTTSWLYSTTNLKISKFNLIKSWIVRQFANEYNPVHWHSGHISGAGFLKVPENFGDSFQKQKANNNNGKLELIHGSRAFLSTSKFPITPKVGDFYFFPHYLMHHVYPFRDNNEERRSISFNAIVDDKVFDVFGGGFK